MAKLDGRIGRLFADRGRYIRDSLAQTIGGENVSPYDKSAYRFCLVGAIMAKYGVFEVPQVEEELMRGQQFKEWLTERGPCDMPTLSTFNDTCGYKTVMKLLQEVPA